MSFSAFSSFLAVTNGSERPASGCSWADSNVGIATVWVGAIAAKEVSASRDTMRGGFMRKIASITSSATTRSKEVFADSDLARIVCVAAAIAMGAHTYRRKSQ
jgi:hypothetical protein